MKVISVFIIAVQLLSFTKAASIPALYDIDIIHAPFLKPLNTAKYTGSSGYQARERVKALSNQKGGEVVTRYEIEEVGGNLEAYYWGGFSGTTLLPGSVTRTYTMDQGASTLHVSIPPGVITTARAAIGIAGVVRDCALDLQKKEAACVEQYQVPYLTVFTGTKAGTVTATATSLATATFTESLRQLQFTNAADAPLLTPRLLFTNIFVCAGVALGIAAVIMF